MEVTGIWRLFKREGSLCEVFFSLTRVKTALLTLAAILLNEHQVCMGVQRCQRFTYINDGSLVSTSYYVNVIRASMIIASDIDVEQTRSPNN